MTISLKRLARSRCGRKKKTCTRLLAAGTFTIEAHAGANRMPFSRFTSATPLRAGRYRATLVATGEGALSSKPVTVRFRLLGRA